jgi:N-acetyl-alpha-D-muramate 1-phosphate uridylyltransferase
MRAMILAAGRGNRLRPLTDGCPKPLIKVGGKPLLLHHLESLKRAGFQEVVINVSHLAEQIVQTIGDGSDLGLRIQYSYEEQALETGGGVQKALPLLGPRPFLLISGDIFTDFPLDKIALPHDKWAHLVLVPNPPYHPEGDFALEGDRVTRKNPTAHNWTYGNIAVIDPVLFEGAQSLKFPLASLFFQSMFEHKISGELYKGAWHNIGTVEDLKKLEDELKNRHHSQKAAS